MREKKRYLLYKIEGQELDEKSLRLLVRKAVYGFLGEHGASSANAKVLEFAGDKFLIKCSLKSVEQVIASLALQVEYNNKPIALRLQKMSGAVKHVWSQWGQKGPSVAAPGARNKNPGFL